MKESSFGGLQCALIKSIPEYCTKRSGLLAHQTEIGDPPIVSTLH